MLIGRNKITERYRAPKKVDKESESDEKERFAKHARKT